MGQPARSRSITISAVENGGTGKVALRAENGDPLAVVVRQERGQVLVQLFGCGLDSSSLPRTTAFVPLVQHVTATLGERGESTLARHGARGRRLRMRLARIPQPQGRRPGRRPRDAIVRHDRSGRGRNPRRRTARGRRVRSIAPGQEERPEALYDRQSRCAANRICRRSPTEEQDSIFGAANVARLKYADLAGQFSHRHEIAGTLGTLVLLAFVAEALCGRMAVAARRQTRAVGRSPVMNFLLKLLGLESGADVHRLVDGVWSAANPLPWQLLALIGVIGLALAAINLLPWISMRLGVRLSTFLLRLGMLVVLLAVLVGTRVARAAGTEPTAAVDRVGRRLGLDGGRRRRRQEPLPGCPGRPGQDAPARWRPDRVVGRHVQRRSRWAIRSIAAAEPGKGPTLFRDVLARVALSRAKVDRLVVLTDGRDSEGRDLARLGEDLKARDIRLSVPCTAPASCGADRGIAAEPERSVIRLGEELIIRGAVQGPTQTPSRPSR